MGYPFGQNITYWFYPLLDNDTASIPAAVTSQTPAIRIFDESAPSRSDALSGSGSLQSITAWVWYPSKKAWSFTIPAVADPFPDSNIPTRTLLQIANTLSWNDNFKFPEMNLLISKLIYIL